MWSRARLVTTTESAQGGREGREDSARTAPRRKWLQRQIALSRSPARASDGLLMAVVIVPTRDEMRTAMMVAREGRGRRMLPDRRKKVEILSNNPVAYTRIE